jgi:hypothetical protein
VRTSSSLLIRLFLLSGPRLGVLSFAAFPPCILRIYFHYDGPESIFAAAQRLACTVAAAVFGGVLGVYFADIFGVATLRSF